MYATRATFLALALLLPVSARAGTVAGTLDAIVTAGSGARTDATLALTFDVAAGTIAIAGPWDQAVLTVAGQAPLTIPAYVMDGSAPPGAASYEAGPAPGSYSLALTYRYQMRSPRASATDLLLSIAGVSDRPLLTASGAIDPGFFADFIGTGTIAGTSLGFTATTPASFQQSSTALAFSVPVPEPPTGAVLAGAALLLGASSRRARLPVGSPLPGKERRR